MKVEWTDNALEQLWAIHEYIAQSSLEYAQRVVDRLTRRTQQIRNFPLSGRVVPEYNAPQIREVIEGISNHLLHKIRSDRCACCYSRSAETAVERIALAEITPLMTNSSLTLFRKPEGKCLTHRQRPRSKNNTRQQKRFELKKYERISQSYLERSP